MVEVATSLLNVNKEDIIKTLYNLEVAGTDYIQIDVMDGKFVEDDTTEKMNEYSEYVKQVTNLPLDIHLMVEDVESYIKSYLALEPYSITFHIEACKNKNEIMKFLNLVKENNIKVGIAINPGTPIENIYEYLPYIHKVIIMTVEPGKGGQKFIESSIEKISNLNIFNYENGFEVDIEVDGRN